VVMSVMVFVTTVRLVTGGPMFLGVMVLSLAASTFLPVAVVVTVDAVVSVLWLAGFHGLAGLDAGLSDLGSRLFPVPRR